MYNKDNYEAYNYAGVPYNDIIWYDITGQPFGTASHFNAIIFGDANNIVDTKGAMAIGGNFVSSRGLSLAYGNDGKLQGTGYSPDLVRFLVGGSVAMQGPLVVIGHVVAGKSFQAAGGSTYMIGKDGTSGQVQELTDLYRANGGSRYWRVSDRNTHYAISSYDVPRYIPADRIKADLQQFFKDAEESIVNYHDCISTLPQNGTVTEHFHEWILRGNRQDQNVFYIDVRPNGLLNKEIRLEIPEGSLAIVILRTGRNAHLQYGLWGDEKHVNNTLYVFEDAENIYMEVPAAIWGSILAPRAMFHAHQTGGNVNGAAALGSFAVNAASGFEFHLYPFAGGVMCQSIAPIPPIPETMPELIEQPVPLPEQPLPILVPQPEQVTCPVCPEPVPCPQAVPCPTCPEAEVCPTCPTCPEVAVCPSCPACPTCPEAEVCPTCPEAAVCPSCPTCPPCPEVEQFPTCPRCPEAQPCPRCPEAQPCPRCPETEPCPPCPRCPEAKTYIEYQPLPIPIPISIPCPEPEPCPECLITPGIIYGCIWGCSCGCNHEWEIRLYRHCGEKKVLRHCIKICCCGCFEFDVDYEDYYQLSVCPIPKGKSTMECKPILTLKNVGVKSLMIE